MGVKERREREKNETRDKILDAARELFVTHGYEGVSMRKVAEKIEYSPAAIYVHFADKEQLFREVCTRDFRAFAESFQEAAQETDPILRLQKTGTAYIKFALQFPNHYRVMFMTPHPEGLDACADEEAKGNPDMDAYALNLSCVKHAMATGRFRDDLTDPELVAQTLWAGVHGLISLEITKGKDTWFNWCPFERRAKTLMSTLMKGMLKE